ncbi:MAG: metallophosphoesterase family protein [Candidatus Woesearchaeota archaeon]
MLLEKILEFLGMRKINKFAVISDIHSNLEALNAIVENIKKRNVNKIYCCGDIIGYGPNPNECIEIVKKNKIVSVMGNHDYALAKLSASILSWFNSDAANSILWTDKNIKDENRDFLKKLPSSYENNLFKIVHGSLEDPVFEYVYPDLVSISNQAENLNKKILFLGHTHYPFLFINRKDNSFLLQYYKIKKNQDKIIRELKTISNGIYNGFSDAYSYNSLETPQESVETIIIKDYDKIILNAGSVGQPRDYNNMASYVVCEIKEIKNSKFDKKKNPELKISFIRVKYDYKTTQEKILNNNLPENNAKRLEFGK